jgi:hypothetical protein
MRIVDIAIDGHGSLTDERYNVVSRSGSNKIHEVSQSARKKVMRSGAWFNTQSLEIVEAHDAYAFMKFGQAIHEDRKTHRIQPPASTSAKG